MAEAAPATPSAPPAPPPAAPSTPPATPWHTGIEPDVVGSWQNKGWDITDPAKLVVDVTKSWKAAERHIGAPADKIVRLPEPNDLAGWKNVWEKLGAPKEAKDYSLPEGVDPALADTLRNTFAKQNMPKAMAEEVAKAFAKHVADGKVSEQTLNEQRKTETLAALQREWGAKFQENQVVALDGARRLGLSQEQVVKLEDALGWDTAAKLMHRIGAGLREPGQLHGPDQSTSASTKEQAQSRLNDLMAEKEGWAKRLQAGGKVEQREFKALMEQIHGVNEQHELAAMGMR
jgi:hypothetical protein